ncbi:polysaccharide biosynthesis/export family protein [Pedobacter endophyticus]|uniref:Polysaccharide biosynthesis/export family protein n=1 Tax=Pedobacter endophyticus TaxID=2789740 RepID=A0A7S9KZX9_9SPHI|nr:polysaccharide biosynthesis/export family protein [Pedobacter endophyticus]QPH39930.1 polysaccharide biosynthesis/export family protein [Pedobacter endophyticus]
MNKHYFLILVTLVVLLSSCGSYKNIPYYQDLERSKQTTETVANFSPLTISPNDILAIKVSSRTPESSAIFSYEPNNNQDAIPGYQVDANGNVHLPVIGTIKAAGFTTTQLQESMNKSLLTYYKDPVVNVRILNFKVSVYGDVERPNVYTLQNERTTITQALSLAGDLNITAMRKTIILVREEGGQRKFIPIDLTSKKIFESPYYYIRNNDEIYVQPDRTKYATVDRGYRTATLVLSGLSIIAIVLSNIYR